MEKNSRRNGGGGAVRVSTGAVVIARRAIQQSAAVKVHSRYPFVLIRLETR
jgi:hypothetical protein